jgi:two-component system, NtrC family, nitrogen regulation sensor histidine kinase NtrY
MFRRYPYWGWLLLSLLLWGITAADFRLHRHELIPGQMARAVNSDLLRKQAILKNFMDDRELVKKFFSHTLSEKENNYIDALPIFIYGYTDSSLIAWNTNKVIGACNDSALSDIIVVRNEKGIFAEQCQKVSFIDEHKRLVVLFPIFISYPVENDYLRSNFVASDYIPGKTQVVAPDKRSPGEYPVVLQGKTICYLHFNYQDIPKWTPDTLFIILLIAALIASMSWIQLIVIYLTRNRSSSLLGFLITLCIVIIFRTLLYVYNLPFNLDTLTFFDPKLYASSKYLESLGDLFISTFCVLWIVIFITRHTPYKTYFSGLKNTPVKRFIAVVLIVALVAYVFFFVGIIRSLVLDSNISFDVGHFYSINIYTILGLLVIGAIAAISCLIIVVLNIQLQVLIKHQWTKYFVILITAIAIVCVLAFNHDARAAFNWQFYGCLVGWLLVFVALLDIPKLALVSDMFEPHMIFWALFICVFTTVIMQYFNEEKEHDTRKAFVRERYTPQPDFEMEYAFDKVANNLEQDKQLKNFFYKPTAAARKTLDQRLDTAYFTGPVSKYKQKVFLFDAEGKELFNKDTTGYPELLNEKDEAASTNSPYLFYKESVLDRRYYLSYIRIYSDTINKVIGYVFIDLDLKKEITQTVYPLLLQQETHKANPQENQYSVAVYVNNKLITQTNEYPFSTNLKNDTLKEQQAVFYRNRNVSELHYKVADKRTVVVVRSHSQFLEVTSLFSYLFCIQVFLAAIILLYQFYLSYFTRVQLLRKLTKLTLRKRVHFSMLTIVLASFLLIGTVTIIFFKNQYGESNTAKLQSALQVAKQSVQDYLKQENAYSNYLVFDTVCSSNKFRYFVSGIANAQKIDINIFDNKARLLATSQEEIFDKGLISRYMRPDAYFGLNELGESIVIRNEKIAGLSYLSAYQPLRDEEGVTLGYLGVPFFSSEKELNFQLSNIVVTLINLYAFIFLLSSIVTVLITRWITGSFNMIIRQFERLNLQRNERIKWPYDDEIGSLVKEYNKMVNKVEENAALLAQSERESAWREMARQVAHEIKNPLTPMKLNIQYLQQSMKKDSPNIKELTDKVVDSIIEQIDNLSYIASEFSNFAKMPEARPEELELGALLHKAVELYLNDERVKVIEHTGGQQLHVFADRSQLLRVFTNLLENAKQSIPDGKKGIIEATIKGEDGKAVIQITDNGAGISEEAVKKIFQPYFTTKSSGTGLGLAMTRKIIEFWKGEIWFETTEGEGTTFYIKLPLIQKS